MGDRFEALDALNFMASSMGDGQLFYWLYRILWLRDQCGHARIPEDIKIKLYFVPQIISQSQLISKSQKI